MGFPNSHVGQVATLLAGNLLKASVDEGYDVETIELLRLCTNLRWHIQYNEPYGDCSTTIFAVRELLVFRCRELNVDAADVELLVGFVCEGLVVPQVFSDRRTCKKRGCSNIRSVKPVHQSWCVYHYRYYTFGLCVCGKRPATSLEGWCRACRSGGGRLF